MRRVEFKRLRSVCFGALCALSVSLGAFGAEILSAEAAAAETTNSLKAKHKYWGAFVSGEGAKKRCFAATKPTKVEKPDGVNDRGEPFLLVSTFPNDGAVNEVSAVLGFEADNAKGVTLTIDGKSYPMFGNGTHAWLTRSEDNAKVVQALRAGAEAAITSTSGRGNTITDHYSLIGFTKALESVAELCK